MAQIPLAEIPNAPQDVTSPLTQATFAGDQVGNELKSEINRGLEGMKVNPLAAAVGGEMIMKGATELQKAATSFGDGVSRLQLKANEQDYATGQIKFYQNKIGLDQQFSEASMGQPIEMHPVIYNQVYGKDGANLYTGMTDRERLWQQPDVLHNYAKGMAEQVNSVGQFHVQQLQTQAMINFQHALDNGNIADAIVQNETNGKKGWFTPHQMAQNQQIIDNKTDVFNVQNLVQQSPLTNDWDKKLSESITSGQPVPGHPYLTDADKRNLINFREIKRNDAEYEIVGSLEPRLDKGEITDLRILHNDPGYKQLRPEKQKALDERLGNNMVGTPIGIANTLHAQQKLDAYPQATTPEGRIKELDDISTLITATVPGEQGQIQQQRLKEIRSEMAGNGGQRSQDAIVKQYYSQYLETAKDGGAFGTMPTTEELKTSAGAEKMLAIEQRIADIKVLMAKGYNGKPITTVSEAKSALQEYMSAEEAAKITPKVQEGLRDWIKRDFRDFWNGGESPAPANGKPQASLQLKPSPGVNPAVYSTWNAIASRFPQIKNEGIWGDAAHQMRKSDHNTGDALDIGVPSLQAGSQIKDQLVQLAQSQPIKYIIHNHQIWNPQQGWHPYHGSNPHESHVHVSFYRDAKVAANNAMPSNNS